MDMTFGTHRGKPVADVPTWYLLWFVSQESLRYAHWPLVEAALHELHGRLGQWDALVAELRVTEAPRRSKAPWRAKQQEAKRAENRRLHAERRQEAFRKETRDRMAWQLARRYNVPSGTMTAEQILEAFKAGTLPGQVPRRAAGGAGADTDFSDLV
ncbi:hypothetical protein [Castellaniella sp.]|uniref:hypothetical protein n=1 Tax=Castellaniella sp. TaxID=1955812 RepID=UPI003A92F628